MMNKVAASIIHTLNSNEPGEWNFAIVAGGNVPECIFYYNTKEIVRVEEWKLHHTKTIKKIRKTAPEYFL